MPPSTHPLRCRCGRLRGEVAPSSFANRAVCYCRDCQSYAHALDRAAETLDPHGGTEVVATLAVDVRFTDGRDALACLSLTERGLLRWYASCCGTPIANTPRDRKLAYVGLMHNAIDHPPEAGTDRFGPVRLRLSRNTARGTPPPAGPGRIGALLALMVAMVRARLGGTYARSPFFGADGRTVATPRVLDAAELAAARRAAAFNAD